MPSEQVFASSKSTPIPRIFEGIIWSRSVWLASLSPAALDVVCMSPIGVGVEHPLACSWPSVELNPSLVVPCGSSIYWLVAFGRLWTMALLALDVVL